MAVFPAKLEAIDAALVDELLRPTGARVEAVEVVEHFRCGDGLASTADRVDLALTYAANPAGLPGRMKLKTIFLHRFLRFGMPAVLATARAVELLRPVPLIGYFARPLIFTLIHIYQRFFPHAPEAMYRNEVNFYRALRDELADVEAPAAYAAVIDDDNGQFGIFMEDLGLREARFPNAVDGVTLAEMESLVANLARLHAHFWESPRLDGELAWLPRTDRGGMYPVFEAIGLNLIKDQVAKHPFKAELIAPLGASLDELWALLWRAQRQIYAEPQTLLHGDAHIANTYVLPDGTGGLLDWQLMVRGPWCHDLAYLLATGLDVETRRREERGLIERYFETLRAHGVTEVPDPERAWRRYRQAAIWGLVIGWLITPPVNYGEAITRANIDKTVAAMRDLETLDAIRGDIP